MHVRPSRGWLQTLVDNTAAAAAAAAAAGGSCEVQAAAAARPHVFTVCACDLRAPVTRGNGKNAGLTSRVLAGRKGLWQMHLTVSGPGQMQDGVQCCLWPCILMQVCALRATAAVFKQHRVNTAMLYL
jgi:hypothetical protein